MSDTDKIERSLLSQQIDQLADTLDKLVAQNNKEHTKLFDKLEKLAVDQASSVNHVHKNCSQCTVNTTDISAIKNNVKTRDKIGIGAILVAIGAFVSALIANLRGGG